ncbi:metallophosphoesterase family protein [Dictyobacter arantiisoli]|uniref:DeoR family transcriptional regulator n=1 Tax=Dictyobacter arantiisoli TaxID=2014874 RepID=A0A5A5TLC8_9CHLR|nr:metallophosphoesterase family protein [Dictyobacter arantiisoli]GCF11774.1 DeoR family transcriptional regulator [Dictyobacter arantiisoli]
MKIAALYDIHGNLPALKAVLKDLERIQPDTIVLGGDIVSGPFPNQTLEYLCQLDLPVVALRGNAEREVVTAFDGQLSSLNLSKDAGEVTQWVAQRLQPDQRDVLAHLPEHVSFSFEPLGEVLFCHATPHSDEVIFTPLTPQERLHMLFRGVEQQVVICGHTHMQFELQVGNVRVINAGSVGMPYADRPGAYWLLLGSDGIEFHMTSYDLEAAAAIVRTSGYPQAQDFAEENILKIPSAEEAMEFFERSTAAG